MFCRLVLALVRPLGEYLLSTKMGQDAAIDVLDEKPDNIFVTLTLSSIFCSAEALSPK